MRLRFQMVSKTHILVLGELSQLPWFAWRYGAMGLALYRLNLKNICLLVNATIYAFIGRIFKFHPNTVCQSYFACTPNFRHAIMAFNVATTSGRVIQIQMAFAHFVATSTTFLYFLSFCTGNILWFVWSSSPNNETAFLPDPDYRPQAKRLLLVIRRWWGPLCWGRGG